MLIASFINRLNPNFFDVIVDINPQGTSTFSYADVLNVLRDSNNSSNDFDEYTR